MSAFERMDRAACYRILFPERRAKQLAEASWGDLLAAVLDPKHEIVRDWPEWEWRRLRALVRLLQLYYPSRRYEPSRVVDAGDVVARFQERCGKLIERTIWLLVLDEGRLVQEEVLVAFGGSTTALPPLRTLLRHGILKNAEAAWVVDFRPLDVLDVGPGLVHALEALTDVGATVGVKVEGWVLMGPLGAVNVAESVHESLKAA